MLKAKIRSVKILGRGVKMKYYFAAVSLVSQLSLEEIVRSMVTLLFNRCSCLVQMSTYPSKSGEIIEMGHVFSTVWYEPLNQLRTIRWTVPETDRFEEDGVILILECHHSNLSHFTTHSSHSSQAETRTPRYPTLASLRVTAAVRPSSYCHHPSFELLLSSVHRAIIPKSPKSNPYSLLSRAQPIRLHQLLVVIWFKVQNIMVSSINIRMLKAKISRFTCDHKQAVAGGRGLPSPFLSWLRIKCGGKIMSRKEDDVKNDSDNDLGDNFDYQPNAEDDAEDDDVDSLDSTSNSEEVCGVKRIAYLMVEDIWNLEFRIEDEACQLYNAYACWHGFVMKKDDMVRDNQGRIIS
ncbi:hypothetical protein S83_004981, partial [Arachis hypogaea]